MYNILGWAMTFDRKIWERPLGIGITPGWRCPACGNGTLEPDVPLWRTEETRASKDAHASEDWEPDWYEATWVGHFSCSSSRCGEVVVAVGRATEDYSWADDSSMRRYNPTYVQPPVHLLALPDGLSDPVRQPLLESFALFWSNPPASAGRIRVALERYLDQMRVPKKRRTSRRGQSRMIPRSLHNRIDVFREAAKKNEELADKLLALKWLCNEGAHDDLLKREDVLDAFEILDSALDHISGNRERVNQQTTRINANKGTRRSKRR